MPHVIVKLYSGRTEDQKKELTRKIVENVVSITGCKERSVSVAIEDVDPEDWADQVYQPDILDGKALLYKSPGYNPFETEDSGEGQTPDLMAYVRQASNEAQLQDESGYFNAMSWLDLELEDNPQRFDPYFDTPWNDLSESERLKRAGEIRRVL